MTDASTPRGQRARDAQRIGHAELDSAYRDSSGKRLEDYPRPSVAVDTAVLTVPDEVDPQLAVLVVRREGRHRSGAWQLPGTFLHPGERLADAALRALRDKVHVQGLHPRQLHVFDDPARDDRGWVLSAAHVDVVPAHRLIPALEAGARLVPVDEVRRLAFDHDEIVRRATQAVRHDYADQPDPARLLPVPFTLLELQRLHEAVRGAPLQKDTFRRRMQDQLVETGGVREGTVGKPAREWTHRT